MRRILDLTEEERVECLNDYIDEFKNSDKGPASTLHLKIRLKSIGMDNDEIDFIIRSL